MIGEIVGSYRIVAKLGEGGMGAVYLGEHQHIARKAAIKVLLPELSANQQIVARFFNEARATSLIRHAGIVEIIDCNVLPNGNAYIVMEYLTGESLGSHLRDHSLLPPARALFVARHIADALSAAHAQHIVHRDLKPDNVFLLSGSDAAPIKILDFGIAKLMHTSSHEGSYKTRTGSLIGTPVYMSPEQCRGAGEIDHRTDIYSLGCILFEMACGRPPFTYEGFGELIQAHLSTTPPRARHFAPSLTAAAEALIARLLAKSPDDRPQTMRELVGELDAVIAGTASSGAANAASERGAVTRPVPRTVLLPQNEPARHTTLGSASSEKLDVVSETLGRDAIPARRGRWPAFVAAAALVVAGAAGFALWPGQRSPSADETRRPPPQVTPSIPEPPPEKPAAVVTPDPPAAPPANAAKQDVTARPGPTVRPEPKPSTEPKPQPAARKVKVVISSEPAGADVCFARDHVLLGKTKFEWSADRSTHAAKLLLRKRGYRGQEIAVATDHDTKREVTLLKLGPDDLDDTDNCEKR